MTNVITPQAYVPRGRNRSNAPANPQAKVGRGSNASGGRGSNVEADIPASRNKGGGRGSNTDAVIPRSRNAGTPYKGIQSDQAAKVPASRNPSDSPDHPVADVPAAGLGKKVTGGYGK